MRKTYTSALCSIALMALTLTGCQQERGLAPDQTPQDGSEVAQFTAGPVTRVVSGTSWEGTEVIGISNVTKAEATTTNVAYKATSAGSTTNFADQGTKLLLPGDKSQVTFAAYYPYASTISEGKASYIISKGSDQPVLFAIQSGTAANPKLPFTFKHKLAQVKIVLTAQEGLNLSDISTVFFKGGVTDVKMNVLTGELTTGTTKGDITLTKEAEGTYSSYVVPQAVENTFAFVMTLGGKSYTLSMDKVNKAPTKLDSGFSYTFKAKLTKDGKVVNPDGSTIGGIDDGGTGDGGDVTPDNPETPGDTPATAQKLPFANDFKAATSLDPFSAFSESGDEAWRISNSGQYKNGAAMSGYNGGAKANVDWLISPALDFTGATAPKLFLNHTIGHAGNVEEQQQVLISKDYVSGDPSKATWSKLTITYPGKPAKGNFSTTDSETDLSAYAGEKNIHIALKYTSTDEASAQWQIGKIEVKEATGTKPGTEDPGTEPGTEEPGTKPEQPTTDNLLFPGADFEDWSAFMSVFMKGNSTGITIEQGNDPTQGGVMKVTGKDSGNKWIFNIQNVQVTNPAPKKITFKVKGTSPSRSFSVVVYGPNGEVAIYNIGDILADKVISEYKTSVKDHKYDGQINTGDQWVTITLDINQVKINNTGSGKIFSAKIGKQSEYNVMLDDFKIE